MAGLGYGKNVRKQMDAFKSATPGQESPDARLAARKSALEGAQAAMAANPSDRIAKRLSRVTKKSPVTPPATTTPTPSSPKEGGGLPLPKSTTPAPTTGAGNILPGDERAGKPTPAGGAPTSVIKKKSRKPITTNPSPYGIT